MRILTHQKSIPWRWAFMMAFPWAAIGFQELISQQPATFTLRKFINDPALISFITSINILFNFLVGVVAAYLSDHVWTRWGRRRPFLIFSAVGAGISLLTIPLMGIFLPMVIGLILYQYFVDLGKSWEPLYNEVIPPPQRGRAGIFRMMVVNLGILFFSTVLIGQFDVKYNISTPVGPLTGEMVLYWAAAVFMFLIALFYIFMVKETLPPELGVGSTMELCPTRILGVSWIGEKDRGKSGVRYFFRTMFANPSARWIYLLYLCPVITVAANSNSSNYILFLVEQLGFSKPELARINGFVMPLLVFGFTPLAGFLADKISRLLMFRIGIIAPALIQVGLFLYLRYVTGYKAGPGLLIVAGIATAFFQSWLWAVWGPLIYDYIPSNRMGTYTAGIVLVSGVVNFLLINLGGLWVKAFTHIFGVRGAGTFDYSSIQLLWAVLAGISLIGIHFFYRAERDGKIRPEGRMELNKAEPAGE